MSWWSETLDGNFQERLKNRFVVKMGRSGNSPIYPVVSVTKPKVNIETKEYKLINHYFKYPGMVRWEPITINFVDAGFFSKTSGDTNIDSPVISTAQTLWEMLLATGYVNPRDVSAEIPGLGRVVGPEKAANIDKSFGGEQGSFVISQLDSSGKPIEVWTIYNPIISSISWGDLDYGDDGFVQYSLEIAYDWAEFSNTE